jgi:cytochrome c biogenesis protein CcdA/thiol-disulfide isomerase/thioredoxin
MYLLLLFAFLAGIVTVLSPCVLPVLPILLSAGVAEGRYRAFGIILGLVLSFSFFTLTLTSIINLTGISANALRYCAIGLITFFGLTMLFPRLGDWFASKTAGIANIGLQVQEKSATLTSGFWSGFLLGVALGLIWTPCAGPILATITTLVATNAVNLKTVLTTLAYSIGTALPMFLIMYGGNKIATSTTALAPYTELIRKIFGALMILGALAIAFHFDVVLQQIAIRYFPMLNIDTHEAVKKELEKLRKETSMNAFSSIEPGALAPDFVGISQWFNTPPLTIEQLRNKVVLIDFWTYSCINCVRTLPYLKDWYAKYKDKGFVIVGVHTPEFEFEKNPSNVQDAIKRFGILYPVALDNHYSTWQAYHNRYWPAHYLINQNGTIYHVHFGEGAYLQTENAIRTLLGLPEITEKEVREPVKMQTPEIYLGTARAAHYPSSMVLQRNATAIYDYKGHLSDDQVGLRGSWHVTDESITSQSDDARLDLNFIANRVYLVMSSSEEALIQVLLDGKPLDKKYYTTDMNKSGFITVKDSRMYDMVDLKGDDGRHIITLGVPKGVSLYAFTFGSGTK